jgi:hypothetical protein
LSRRGLQQVRSSHDFCDLHERVIHGYRKLIRRDIIAPPDDEIPEVTAGNKRLFPKILILEFDRLAIRNAKTPVDRDCRDEAGSVRPIPTRTRI